MLPLMVQAAPPPAPPEEITIVGRRAEQGLAACLQRSCPPAEEIEAALQASVEQFADGRYVDARRTLRGAIDRNRDHAAELPGPVSSLYATVATVAEHEGETAIWRMAARKSVTVLRRHLGETNSATLVQELSLGDSMVGLGLTRAATNSYRAVQRKATESGQPKLAANAAFRRAWLALNLGRSKEAERFADEAVAIAGPDDRQMAELREVLRTRTAIRRGDDGALDALAARLRQSATVKPQLLFTPPLAGINPAMTGADGQAWHDSRLRFADVGYWIRPDGRTAEVEVLRNSGLGDWAPGFLHHVSARRYTPLDVEPGQPGIYRIDRFTMRANKGTSIGTRIRHPVGKPSVYVVDLTETDAMSAAHRQRTEEALGPLDN